MKHLLNLSTYLTLTLLITLFSCSDDTPVDNTDDIIEVPPGDPLAPGSGIIDYTYEQDGYTKSLDIYYFLPDNYTPQSPILFVFHGAGRNADDYRDAMISKSQELGFLVFTPEFSIAEFPNGDAYNLGNVYVDGDNPTPQTLNPESEWAFSIIEPLYDYVKTLTNNETSQYDLFGHSAGGQFVHRFLMFKPSARVHTAVASASGWYTFPDETIPFPYGYDESILLDSNLSNLFSKHLIIQVGENDDDPNSAGLRHNTYADAQGLNRKERATNFFQYCSTLATQESLTFNWQFQLVPDATHDFNLPSEYAADLLYN